MVQRNIHRTKNSSLNYPYPGIKYMLVQPSVRNTNCTFFFFATKRNKDQDVNTQGIHDPMLS